MKKLAKIFNFNREENYEKKDLTYQIFSNIDFSIFKSIISFYRSDFRGSNFDNIIFKGVNFKIADFINNIISDF